MKFVFSSILFFFFLCSCNNSSEEKKELVNGWSTKKSIAFNKEIIEEEFPSSFSYRTDLVKKKAQVYDMI